MTRVLFVAVFLLAPNAFSQERSATALTSKVQSRKFVVQLKSGHHFNDKAPNAATVDGKSVGPSLLQARRMEFSLPVTFKEGRANVFVCDDAVTYCEVHDVAIRAGSGGAKAAGPKSARAAKLVEGDVKKQTPHAKVFEETLAKAKKTKRLALLDFSAAWCPGCVRYAKEIFPTREYKDMTKDFVEAKIDVDQFENFAVSDRYKIKGIPTMVVVDGDGNEIARLVDFHFHDRLRAFFESVKEDPTPLMVLDKSQFADPETRLKWGRRLLAAGRFDEAIEVLGAIQDRPPEYLAARAQKAQSEFEAKPGGKESFQKEIRALIKEEPNGTRSLAWRSVLAKSLSEDAPERGELVKEGRKLAEAWLASPEKAKQAAATDELGEFMGYERVLVGYLLADLLESAGAPKAESEAALKRAGEIVKAEPVPSQPGPALRGMIVLIAAGMHEDALARADDLLKADPGNLDIQRRKMRALQGLDKHQEAIKIGEKIISQVEGRNQFWVAESLAKSYAATGRPKDAKKLAQAYLARPEAQSDMLKSSRKALETFL